MNFNKPFNLNEILKILFNDNETCRGFVSINVSLLIISQRAKKKKKCWGNELLFQFFILLSLKEKYSSMKHSFGQSHK